MPVISPVFLSLAVGTLFLAGFVKGTTGFGISLIVVPMLALVVTPQEAIVLISIPVMAMNIVTAATTAQVCHEIRRIRWMLPVAFFCVPLGVKVLVWVDPGPARAVIGLMIVFFIGMRIFGFQPPRVSYLREKIFGIGMGALIGFIFGMIMMPVAFIIFYVTTLGVRRETFIFLLNSIAASLSMIQVSSLAWHGLYSYDAWQNTAAMLPPALIGLYVGTRLRRRLSEKIFERLVLVLLGVSGIILIVRYGIHLI